MHLLAMNLGLIKDEHFFNWKGVYFTENKYSNDLGKILEELIEIGVLEFNKEELRVRKNDSFEIKLK
jgi:hypothetical protein